MTKKRDWQKFGSPYDPGHTGKMPLPQSEAEQHRLRGCGDPGCSICNPDTAAAGLGGTGARPAFAGQDGAGSPSMFDLGQISEGYVSRVRNFRGPAFTTREMGEALYGSFAADVDDPPAPPPVPESFKAARRAVERWLSVAPEQAFGDIVGNEAALEQLRDAIEAPVVHADLYAAYGMKMPRGALLSGPPGCGKTMFARAAASEMKRLYGGAGANAGEDDVEFVAISGSELQSPFVGVTEGYIKAIFTFAREYQALRGHPLLVFLDEADVLLPDRTGRVRPVASWEESQVATFLAEMDGIHESGAFVLLASNRPEVIDQAVLRDGRCDFKITVKRPTQAAVEAILRNNFAGTRLGEDALEALVFAAVEALYDPHKVIAHAQALKIDVPHERISDVGRKHFLLEHIVSGAIAASIPRRATRHAFARDKADGVARGVTVADVLAAVNDVFEENKDLEHGFALEEFKRGFEAELRARDQDGAG